MAFKVPEQYRLTEKHAKSMAFLGEQMLSLVTQDAYGNNGYFYLPRSAGAKGMYFLVKALDKDGWNCLAVYVPSEARAPRWEELFYVKQAFWTEGEVVHLFFPGKQPFIAAPGWVHLWQAQDPHQVTLPPIFDSAFHFKKRGFWQRLWMAFKKAATENR